MIEKLFNQEKNEILFSKIEIIENKIFYDNKKLTKYSYFQFTCRNCSKSITTQHRNFSIEYLCSSCKRKNTFLKIYGVDNPWKNKKIIDKIKNKRTKEARFKQIKTYKRNKFLKYLNLTNVTPMFSAEEYHGHDTYKWKCKICDNIFLDDFDHGRGPSCTICNPIHISKYHREILQLLNNFQTEINNRTIIYPLELDIYIPSHSLAIEFNGLYWHSSEYKEKWYHQFKVEKCDRLGIRLLHIYEWEWVNNKQKCIDKIYYYLNHSDRIKSRKPIAKFLYNYDETTYGKHNFLIWT